LDHGRAAEVAVAPTVVVEIALDGSEQECSMVDLLTLVTVLAGVMSLIGVIIVIYFVCRDLPESTQRIEARERKRSLKV
jgi:Mn2+/Fe2+ NRAMP family transporter